MITVDYYGRSGNQLFQYALARILCIERNDWMYTPPPEVFLPINHNVATSENKPERGINGVITDHNIESAINGGVPSVVTHLYLHGYFQRSWFYNTYRDLIKEMFTLPDIQKNYDDIVIHLRLADYFWHKVNSVISPEWYINIVKGQQYKKCYVVVEDHPTNKKYLQFITGGIRNCEVVTGGSALEEFNFIRSFDRIVCSNSTFCWWAAFLSNATKIWTFKPWMNKIGAKYMPDLAGIAGAIEADGKFFTDRELAGRDWEEYWNK